MAEGSIDDGIIEKFVCGLDREESFDVCIGDGPYVDHDNDIIRVWFILGCVEASEVGCNHGRGWMRSLCWRVQMGVWVVVGVWWW